MLDIRLYFYSFFKDAVYYDLYAYSYVPEDFGKRFTVPFPKDKLGDFSSIRPTYRCIKLNQLMPNCLTLHYLEEYKQFLDKFT